MRVPFRWRPSFGFLWLVVVVSASVGFFAWGLTTPVLEEVWRLDVELRAGERPPLSRGEASRTRAALWRYPELADFLTEDKHAGIFSANDAGQVEGRYAYLVRADATSPGRLAVSYAGAGRDLRLAVRVRSADADVTGLVAPTEPLILQLPDDEAFPQLVEILIAPVGSPAGRHPVQIDLEQAP